MERNMLRDYLEQIRLLETDIYTMNESISSLQKLKKRMPEYHPPTAPKKPADPVLELPSKSGTVAGALALAPVCWGLGSIIYINHRKKKAEKLQSDYNMALQQNQLMYAQALKEYEEQLSHYEKNRCAEQKRVDLFNENLDTQLSALQSSIAASQTLLNRLYDLNIVYKKYRNLIAITMFCEYFDSGLRTQLEGENGMYDLYEQQLMGKMIIGELSAVNSNLRTISYKLGNLSNQLTNMQRNQLMLYEEVAKSNSIVSDIKHSTEQLLNSSEKHLSAIQRSTEMAAFQAEATARRTNAIAKMAEYEFAARHAPLKL